MLAPLTQPAAAQPVEADTAPPPPPKPRRSEPEQAPTAKPQETPPPKANSNRNSAGRQDQRAAGSGGGREAGQSGGAQTATSDPGEAKLRTVWGSKIRARIERNKRGPSGGKSTARVFVQFTVARDGRLLDYRITKSSGIAAYDQAALDAITRSGKFPKAPRKLQASQIRLSLPISFTR